MNYYHAFLHVAYFCHSWTSMVKVDLVLFLPIILTIYFHTQILCQFISVYYLPISYLFSNYLSVSLYLFYIYIYLLILPFHIYYFSIFYPVLSNYLFFEIHYLSVFLSIFYSFSILDHFSSKDSPQWFYFFAERGLELVYLSYS